MELRDKAAIVGVGYTPFSRCSGVSTTALAAKAIIAAAADAGLNVTDLDGMATYSVGDSVGPNILPMRLGMKDVKYYLHQFGGGSASHSIVAEAAMACVAGVADYVVCYRALNGRSGTRVGAAPVAVLDEELKYLRPYGYFSAAQAFAMAARAHFERFGTTSEHLGHVAVQFRANAMKNERAMMRTPLTMEEYLGARMISSPFRLFDCCQESDGACAVIVTTAERARDLAKPPVLISGMAWGPGHTRFSDGWWDLTETAAKVIAPRLFKMADCQPEDCDVITLYDAFTHMVLLQLEDYGFCKKGEGGPYVAGGGLLRNSTPHVNPHGGMLSEGYVHGFNNLTENVLQLRGECGLRQVPGARIGLSTGEAGMNNGQTCAVLLRSDAA